MIHRYQNNGFFIVLDVNSGCVHVVDEMVYDLIPIVEAAIALDVTKAGEMVSRALEQTGYSQAQCEEAIGETLEVIEAGMLFTEDAY